MKYTDSKKILYGQSDPIWYFNPLYTGNQPLNETVKIQMKCRVYTVFYD